MIKVLVVDDSALVRKILTEELNRQKDIEVVGTAIDPYAARDKIIELKPDVLTLDLEMPRMDGLSFLEKLMKHYPMPVVVVSSLTPKNSENALMALRLGAVDVICKPGSAYSTQNISVQIVKAIRTASVARFDRTAVTEQEAGNGRAAAGEAPVREAGLIHTTSKLIAMGASTGGTRAIELVLKSLPPDTPGIAMVQHMPPVFTTTFAERLNQISPLEVREARDRDRISPGVALLAPGNYHMQVEKSGASYYVRIKQGPPVHHQRPSVDVLFHSVASAAGVNATGVLMTGMGSDGAKGMLAMKQAGAHNIVQNEATSVVFGMPREAIKIGAASEISALADIPGRIVANVKKTKTAQSQG
ncbi:protein-glutamate methylesterase/protein-glutamine glutaminase [Natronogracilivirga saccharolytica]|uniref:Protein-glutamate methylesterase/protein-glutamine glutaminase n=1 Tax=Natronogracilivirga saccharolytica TaxID=2812953 RepID=A0A8J7UUV7_9BACT|nr:chemotaxis response regulator protein-glutamate methylesterase [Natronogracilivirga saccharolytica]MBP3191927.1 chemotaxis response regulator protein-glutamate methylesterase [Natronogracilivirga saccharolytica]